MGCCFGGPPCCAPGGPCGCCGTPCCAPGGFCGCCNCCGPRYPPPGPFGPGYGPGYGPPRPVYY